MENAIWELEYLVKEKGFKGCKVYPPDDCPINDKVMWPLYQAIRDLIGENSTVDAMIQAERNHIEALLNQIG